MQSARREVVEYPSMEVHLGKGLSLAPTGNVAKIFQSLIDSVNFMRGVDHGTCLFVPINIGSQVLEIFSSAS